MLTRGWQNARLAGTAGVATIALVVARGNYLKPAADNQTDIHADRANDTRYADLDAA